MASPSASGLRRLSWPPAPCCPSRPGRRLTGMTDRAAPAQSAWSRAAALICRPARGPSQHRLTPARPTNPGPVHSHRRESTDLGGCLLRSNADTFPFRVPVPSPPFSASRRHVTSRHVAPTEPNGKAVPAGRTPGSQPAAPGPPPAWQLTAGRSSDREGSPARRSAAGEGARRRGGPACVSVCLSV